MTDPVYIKRIEPDPDGLDFEGLKQEGITLLQKLSGKSWTDYNLHDPGVTILEVLCYALTDLVYRTEFEVADFLTGPDETIDFETQALFRPQDILPSQAVTRNDYRKLIFDSTPEIDNVWIIPVGLSPSRQDNGHPRGLYCISVVPAEAAQKSDENTINESERTRIKEDIRCLYAANRNLCEDLKSVEIVEPKYYSLKGTIEIGGQRDPDDILAEIYFRSSKYLCPGLKFQTFDEMLRQGKTLEEILTGPLTEHGHISADDLDLQREYALISELIGIINEIEGVKFVDDLRFIRFADGPYSIKYDPKRYSIPCLHFPKINYEVQVKLEKNGRVHPVALNNVRAEFERLIFEDRALRRTRQDIAKVCDLPHGEYRNFRDYYSIQHHFPEIYGIGEHGVPAQVWPAAEHERESAGYGMSERARPLMERKRDSDRRQARARQLKAYLLLFEQTMANYLANLQELSRLFSANDQLDRSYFHQMLDNKSVPAIVEIYREEPTEIDTRIAQLLRQYDNFRDRRNRILDYLLGIYGESFTQSSLRHFKGDRSEHEFEREMILNKITLLKEIRELSRKRAGAFNYLEKSWETGNISSLQKKVNILLGLRNFNSRALARKLHTQECEGCHVLEHILLRPSGKKYDRMGVQDDFFSFKISVLFPAWTPRFANKEFRKLAEETVQLNCPAHVLPVFYWLDFAKMEEFEALYQDWLEKKCDTDASDAQINESSQKLIEFLQENQES
jgi:hypothetical protein